MALPVCEGLGLGLWAVEYVKEAGYWYLRVYIDKEGGVGIDDCEAVSRKLESLLDTRDFIDTAYMLEVSSPGIDRVLKRPEDFERYAGECVDVKLYKAVNKAKSFQGKLLGLRGTVIAIETDDGQTLEFDQSAVASCRLAVIF